MNDAMAGAVMEGYRLLRDDDRVQRLPPGSSERRRVIDEHLTVVSDRHGVGREALAMEIANRLPRPE